MKGRVVYSILKTIHKNFPLGHFVSFVFPYFTLPSFKTPFFFLHKLICNFQNVFGTSLLVRAYRCFLIEYKIHLGSFLASAGMHFSSLLLYLLYLLVILLLF